MILKPIGFGFDGKINTTVWGDVVAPFLLKWCFVFNLSSESGLFFVIR